MTITAVEITTRRSAETSTRPAGRHTEPAGVIVVSDVEALASTNLARCNDDNPYR